MKQMDEIWQAMEESSFGVAIMKKGVARGQAEGRAQGLIFVVQITWLRHFGEMSAAVVAALECASEIRLRDILILFVFGTTPTEAKVRAQLGI